MPCVFISFMSDLNIFGQAYIVCIKKERKAGYMKNNYKYNITFHNPNGIKDAEKIAFEFISRATADVLRKMASEQMIKDIKNDIKLIYSKKK